VLSAGGWNKHWIQDLAGAGLAIAVGIGVLSSPLLSSWFERWSYDLAYPFRPDVAVDDVAIVSTTDTSRLELGQGDGRSWDPQLHADLLSRLIARGARAVAFTSVLYEHSTNAPGDQAFAQALRRARGKVLLAATSTNGTLLLPASSFTDVAPWGLLTAGDSDEVARKHPRTGGHPTLSLRLAQLIDRNQPAATASRWFNYYGPSLNVPVVPYELALRGGEPAGAFKGKVVVVDPTAARSETFAAPHTLWTGRRISRAEVEATAFLNLWRRDWLFRLPPLYEGTFIAIVGGFLGLVFLGKRRGPSLVLAAVAIVAIFAFNCLLIAQVRLWFPWLIIAGAQVPAAYGWARFCEAMERRREPQPAIAPSPGGLEPDADPLPESLAERSNSPAHPAAADTPVIPDHTVVKRIGRGAYGEVWLARDVIGRFHAAKVLKARSFAQRSPYEREFKGIERFASVSRGHSGLVQVLHVGRNDESGYFFYIMELADDAGSTGPLVPERYVPKTLASELTRRGHLSVRESVKICLDLCAALQHLHDRQLVHRDIKPANIIFVEGRVKIADIGLVAPIVNEPGAMTRLGTEGYLAPEGPGTPLADVYALGKVLYEISMGRDRWQFPEFPTTIGARPDQADLRRLHEIILTACENDPAQRYQSARALREALTKEWPA
jgi:CHASE2 domain-containing sensor protein